MFPPSPPLFSSEQIANVIFLVWEKTKRDRRVKQVAEENKIEMEDDEGNVMSAKTYNDLKAQGII
jgi:SF3a60/Prp9 C-terminal